MPFMVNFSPLSVVHPLKNNANAMVKKYEEVIILLRRFIFQK
jgi:hypothetical protein